MDTITQRHVPRRADDRVAFIVVAGTGVASLLPDIDVYELARIDRQVLFLETEDHREHPEVYFLLAFIRELYFG
jgi:hypothetical protein